MTEVTEALSSAISSELLRRYSSMAVGSSLAAVLPDRQAYLQSQQSGGPPPRS